MNPVEMEQFAVLLTDSTLALIPVKMFNVDQTQDAKSLIEDLSVSVMIREWMEIPLIFNMDAFLLFVSLTAIVRKRNPVSRSLIEGITV